MNNSKEFYLHSEKAESSFINKKIIEWAKTVYAEGDLVDDESEERRKKLLTDWLDDLSENGNGKQTIIMMNELSIRALCKRKDMNG